MIYTLLDRDENMTKKEAAARFYPGMTVVALPQAWLDHITIGNLEAYEVLAAGVVWGYPKGSIAGRPIPLTTDAYNLLRAYGQL